MKSSAIQHRAEKKSESLKIDSKLDLDQKVRISCSLVNLILYVDTCAFQRVISFILIFSKDKGTAASHKSRTCLLNSHFR